MASPDLDTLSAYSFSDLKSPALEVPTTNCSNLPKPPPPPNKRSKYGCFSVPKETVDIWDKLFLQGVGADLFVIAEDRIRIPVHSSLLRVASPALLQRSMAKDGIRYVKIPGVPFGAVHMFLRFIYSSCYERREMNKYVLHLLVLSHAYSVPSLKRVCTDFVEREWLNKENVVDVLQLARNCDAPRLSLFCVRMIVKDLKGISATEGWKAMKRSNPALEQELLESVVEWDSRNEERLRKAEEEKVYLQVSEAMEALLHICKEGCRTIGPRDKLLKGGQLGGCGFPACKGLERLVRHFSSCRTRVPGGCVHCKRTWQLLELHSRMCNQPESCRVPLCRHLKEKMQEQSKKEETKWKLLVAKVTAAKNKNAAAALIHTRRYK